jgi:hypothetical protein
MIRQMTRLDLVALSTCMRGVQKKALLGLTAEDTSLPTLMRLWDMQPIGVAFERDGKLECVGGALPVHPGVASTFMYSTEDFKKVVLEVTRFFKRQLIPTLSKMGIHRVHALGRVDDLAGIAWKEQNLGMWPEAYFTRYGRDRGDYVLHTLQL